ncbi:toxin VasX [Pseudomonas sp. NUPR-001]|uniref:toxin VasX n=1 Tax=Pseudomonas sp. NUPR-001 TaxID=3416058 RepID=UPI003F98D92A
MTPHDQAPYGTCPLLAAVLPLRYALGPTAAIDTSAYDLPPLSGQFPELGPRHPDLSGQTLNYTSRLLRDGWLYVWQSSPGKLVEYQVEAALLTQTKRAGRVIDTRSQPHLLLRAGVPAGLVWSPVRWSESQYQAAKQDPAVRQRIMRTFVPGVAPFSGQIGAIKEQIGEYRDPNLYGWSSEPATEHAPEWPKVLRQMSRCEQQTYVVIDDAWGVLLDLAALMRARKAGFDNYQEHHAEDWAIAGVLQSMMESDRQLRDQWREITRYEELNYVWQDQGRQEHHYSIDMRRLAQLWVDWFNTLGGSGPSTMDTACGHFDLIVPATREALEVHFATACLGPATTSIGAKAITSNLEGNAPGKPWLLWALLGLPKRLGIGEIKSLVDLANATRDDGTALKDGITQLAKAVAYAAGLNNAAEKLAQHAPASSQEALFLALAPAAGMHLHQAENAASTAGRIYMTAALARSGQRIQTLAVTPRQLGEWYSDQIGTRKTLPARLKAAPLASAVSESIPFMHLVPANTKLPPLPVNLAANADLGGVFDVKGALSKAPVKSLVALVAGANFVWAGSEFYNKPTYKSGVSAAGALLGVGAATASVFQRVAEVNWTSAVRQSGGTSISSRLLLVKALERAADTALAQSVVLAFDVVLYGVDAFEAYEAGDFDTMAINLALSGASLASISLQVQAFRAFRAARAAVIVGDAAAIARGVNVVPHLMAKLLGLTALIVGGLIARLYTTDSPLEQWVKRGRFGISPDTTWSNSYSLSMDKLYPILFPVSFDAHRLREIHPYQGTFTSTYLILNLPGEQVSLTDDMIHFSGQEVWGDTLGYYPDEIRKVEWTGEDFAPHSGTRIPVAAGITPYRRVYHEDGVRDLRRIEGELIYSPQEGLTLPVLKIMERAWI